MRELPLTSWKTTETDIVQRPVRRLSGDRFQSAANDLRTYVMFCDVIVRRTVRRTVRQKVNCAAADLSVT